LVVKRSTAITEKFFPSDVRNRLLEQGTEDEKLTKALDKQNPKHLESMTTRSYNEVLLNLDHQEVDAVAFQGKPIATLFPDCTVMFAQIVGFSAWSAKRPPEDVFTLLETVYREFDLLTKLRGVFKVETVRMLLLVVVCPILGLNNEFLSSSLITYYNNSFS